MYDRCLHRFLYSFIVCTFVSIVRMQATALTEAQKEEIIARVKEKGARQYRTYAGVECLRRIVSRQYDDRTGEYKGGYVAVIRRREYFYRKAENTVVSFSREGSFSIPKKYLLQTRPPVHPPFDAAADTHYRLTFAGEAVIQGVPCWRIAIEPLKKTSRHLKGHAYITVKELDLLYLESTVADLPTGVKSFSMEVFFKKLGDAYVIDYGTYSLTVNIPLFFPHRRMVQTFTSEQHRLIPAAP